jgi:hypothetical protein
LVAEIADGVHEAHRLGVLHRDLKPGNVLLARVDSTSDTDPPRFSPKVSDFGLAKVFDAGGEATTPSLPSGAAMGTRGYMSPEQFRGDRPVREPSDVYSLGVILFELLTRTLPYRGLAAADALSRWMDESPPPSPRSVRPDIPRDLETICRICLAKAAEDRYPTAAALADDLRRFSRGDPVAGSPWWKRVRSRIRRHRTAITVGLPATLLLAGLGVTLETRSRNNASVWLTRLSTASTSQLPSLLVERDPPDWRVVPGLNAMFQEGPQEAKFAAAFALAASRSDCANYAGSQLLSVSPEEIGPLLQAFRTRAPKLVEYLETTARTPTPVGHVGVREVADRRRATAAAALVLLDRADVGFELLKWSNDCQARTFLVHTLGPAGVAPEIIVRRLEHEQDAGITRALILSLGEIPDDRWNRGQMRQTSELVLALYESHPDPGVHGAAKWLLTHWQRALHNDLDLSRRLLTVDKRLADAPQKDRAAWRISPTGLTLITIETPGLDRLVEISDTETARDLFCLFRPEHIQETEVAPDPGCPANRVTDQDAFAFCEWLADREGIAVSERCHARNPKTGTFGLVAGWTGKSGYRLMTDREFTFAASAGATTLRYPGDSLFYLDRYVRYAHGTKEAFTILAVASLKPNDLGFFDLLGNAADLIIDESARSRDQVIRLGGGSSHTGPNLAIAAGGAKPGLSLPIISRFVGFRVARTVPQASQKGAQAGQSKNR